MDLYTREQNMLMQEFEEMKRQELRDQYEGQNKLIRDYKSHVAEENEQLRVNSESMRVSQSNEVRGEQMNLETVKTATYNRFTKLHLERQRT